MAVGLQEDLVVGQQAEVAAVGGRPEDHQAVGRRRDKAAILQEAQTVGNHQDLVAGLKEAAVVGLKEVVVADGNQEVAVQVFGLLLEVALMEVKGGLQAEAVMAGLQEEAVKVGRREEAQDGHPQDPAQAPGNLEVEVMAGNRVPVYYL